MPATALLPFRKAYEAVRTFMMNERRLKSCFPAEYRRGLSGEVFAVEESDPVLARGAVGSGRESRGEEGNKPETHTY
jgi:hypothetical protein